jgi:short subunit dehydrogenase-like uncharacterized protein
MKNAARVVVIGATGFTGTLVAHELAAGETPHLLTARSPERLAALAQRVGGAETRRVDVTDPGSVAATLRPGDVVINCAGPFTDLGEPVVDACIRAGAHYLDTTGEQRFMKRILDRYSEAARGAGVVVVNAMAFEYALGDCAAALATAELAGPLRSVDMVYAWGGGTDASRGTRLSVLRVVRDGGWAYSEGGWVRQRTGAERRTVRLPDGRGRPAIWFPAGEILTVPRRSRVERVSAWMVTGPAMAAVVPLAAPVLPTLVRAAEPVAKWLLQRAPEGPTPDARQRSSFRIRAEARGAGARNAVTVEGVDPYGVTAAIAVHAARRILDGEVQVAGVLTPAQVLRADELHNAPQSWGITLQEEREFPD